MLKEVFKKVISQNVYLNEMIYRNLSRKSLIEMKQICAMTNKMDTIEDIQELSEFRSDVEKGKSRYYTTDPNFSNARIYGIWNSIFGDIDDKKVIEYPAIEHGLIFHEQIFTDISYTARASSVTFSDFRKRIIHKYKKEPVFCVGPYIYYAKEYYKKEKCQIV